MPYHLELGSGGHSFGGKAIVVNSKTGAHMTRTPENMGKATERLEKAEKKGEDVVWNKALRMSEKAYNKEQWHAKRAKKAPAAEAKKGEEKPKEAEPETKKEEVKQTEGQYWLEKLNEISAQVKQGKVFKGQQWEDKAKSHTFYRVVDEARHSKYDQNFVMFEWNEKGITAANKDENGHGIQNISMRMKSSINEKIDGKVFHLELQVAKPWKSPGNWDTHMLIFFDEKINMNTLSDAEVLSIMRVIITKKFGA